MFDFNNSQQVEDLFRRDGDRIACVIVEPIAGNMNLVRASAEFLATLRRLCSQWGALLIFDEVMTGFRVALGGAQSLFGIAPDLTMLGKVIGGGMPLAAFGGRRDVMKHLAPLGAVYQAGTLSGNPVAVACGLATLSLVQAPNFYAELERTATSLVSGLVRVATQHGATFCADNVGGMFGLYFLPTVPRTYAEVMSADKPRFNAFFHAMLERGVYFAPSAYEAGFVSAAHSASVVAETIKAADAAFSSLAK